jgi:osmotically-inducible protein OsmY
MGVYLKKTSLALCFFVTLALGSVAVRADARPVAAPANEQMKERVQAALRSDPYFEDAHVDVSIENQDVVLRGLVFSDWDLRDALRIARKAAGNSRVIDDLYIVSGGNR